VGGLLEGEEEEMIEERWRNNERERESDENRGGRGGER